MNENEIERVKRKKKLVVSALLQVLDSDSDEDLITMVVTNKLRKRRKPRVAIKNYVENVVSFYTDDLIKDDASHDLDNRIIKHNSLSYDDVNNVQELIKTRPILKSLKMPIKEFMIALNDVMNIINGSKTSQLDCPFAAQNNDIKDEFWEETSKQPRRKRIRIDTGKSVTEADFENYDCSEEIVEDNTDLELTVGTIVIAKFPGKKKVCHYACQVSTCLATDNYEIVGFKCVSDDKDVFIKNDKDIG
ncbi:hypothetical protein FQA39_LY07238 [Lamprigera yunnana]|nr:hypothetical protein FQA39_LY07238 [Lamprigera yunnana]